MRRLVRIAMVLAVAAAGATPALAVEANNAALSPPARVAPAPEVPTPPALRGFLDAVAQQSPLFQRCDYREHARGAAGFSVDILLVGGKLDARGFYAASDATAFLLAVDKVAADAGAGWRALYNDAQVGAAIARRAKHGFVEFVGQPRLGRIELLNYHGPAPLKLHIHLDVALGVTGKR